MMCDAWRGLGVGDGAVGAPRLSEVTEARTKKSSIEKIEQSC